MAIGVGSVNGQTRTYLNGTKTGNYFGGGAAISLGPGSASLSIPPMTAHTTTNFLGAGTAFRYFYGDNSILTGATTVPVKLRASQDLGLLGLLGAGSDVYVEFRNTSNTPIPAGTTTYFKIKEKPTLSGISVAVGGLLGLVELQSINGRGYTSAGDYILNTANTAGGASYNGNESVGNVAGTTAGTTTKMLIDKNGDWYAAVTPDAAYNAARLEVALPSDLRVADIARALEANVYSAFTLSSGGTCNTSPIFTSPGEATGINLNTGIIGGLDLSQLVANPQYAINGVAGQYSSFSSGVASVGVASTVSQTFYYDHTATANDGIHVNLGLSNSLIGLSLLQLNGIVFYAYSGSSEIPVYTKGLGDLASLLGLDLLNLVNIGSSQKNLDFSFNLNVPFDRFKIEFQKGVLGVGVIGDALRIYDVSIAPALPTITVQPTSVNSTNICEGNTASFSLAATVPTGSTGPTYSWQYYDGTSWNTISGANSASYTTGATTASMNNWLYRVLVTGGNPGCPQTVISNEAKLTINPRATAANITVANATICEGSAATLSPTSTLTAPVTFKWYLDANKATPITTGGSYTVDASGNLTISGLTAINSPYNYYVSVSNSANCENAAGTLNAVSVTVNTQPVLATIPPQSLCNGQSLDLTTLNPADTKGTTTGTYVWSLTQGGTALSSTTITPSLGLPKTYYVRYTNATCYSDQSVVVTVYAPPTIAAAGTNQNLCNSTTTDLEGNAPVVGTGAWSLVSGPNTPTFTTPSLYNSSVTGLAPGVYVFRWTISSGPCTKSSSDVTVTVFAPPTTANAGSSQSLCGVTSTNLSGNLPTTGSGQWTFKSGPTVPSITSPLSNTTQVKGLVTGTYVFSWIIQNSVCPMSTSDVTVTVNPLPSITLQPLVPICANRTGFKINYTNPINSPTSYTIQWDPAATTAGWVGVTSTPLTGGVISITMPNNVPASTYHGTLTINNGTCSNDIPINIDIYATPHQPNISIAN